MQEAVSEGSSSGFVGVSAAAAHVRSEIRRLAWDRWPVSLEGATGTGKEVVAQLLHSASGRRGRFVAVNCSTLTPGALHSQLFGHEAGSFTDGRAQHRGFFEEADGGTLLLDEFIEAPREAQAMLLRIIEDGKLLRFGGRTPAQVDVRLVLTFQRPMPELLSEGRLRHDLFHRISGSRISLPPLAERPDDVAPLASHFSSRYAVHYACAPLEILPETVVILRKYPWPGNVRELRTEIQRAYASGVRGELRPEGLSPGIRERIESACGGRPARDRARDGETARRALTQAKGSAELAARLLGVSRATFYRRLRSDVSGTVSGGSPGGAL